MFQGQIHEAQEFQRVVSSYKPELEQLSQLATEAQRSKGDREEEGPSVSSSKMAEIEQSYNRLKALIEERRSMLKSFMPSVQQYNSSRGAWEDLLCGWEGKAAALPPPAASPKAIREQIDDIKVCNASFGQVFLNACVYAGEITAVLLHMYMYSLMHESECK